MCCSIAPFQVQWTCSVEFCLIFSTFSLPASTAVNFWGVFHQKKQCCVQLWFDLYSCQTEASIESSKSVQLLHVLGRGKAANSAPGRTLPGTPSSSVTPSLQNSPSTSKIEQDRWGNGRMVIVTSKRSSSCLPCSNHQSTHHHRYCRSGSWQSEAGSAAVQPISVFHQAASSTSSSPKFLLLNAESVGLKCDLFTVTF